MMNNWIQHYWVELGLRGLSRDLRTTALAVLLLALGLAAVMSMLTLLAMLSGDPLPGISSHLHLAYVDSRQPEHNTGEENPDRDLPPFLWKLPDAQAVMALHPNLRQTALASTILQLSEPDTHRNHTGRTVLAQGPMPAIFGVPLVRGRFWTAQEERDGVPVVVLAERAARELFEGEEALGHEVKIGERLFRVVGIAGNWNPKPRFHFMGLGESAWAGDGDSAFLPLRAALDARVAIIGTRECDEQTSGGFAFDQINLSACRWLALWAELSTQDERDAYTATLAAFAQERHAAGVFEREPASRLDTVPEWLDANRVVPDSVRLNLWLAAGLLGLCMVNVAGLLAARFLRRGGELGIRRVLGAPRASVVWQCLVEAAAIGTIGGVLALPLTLFGLWLIRIQDQGYTEQAHLDGGLFGLLLLLAIAVGVLVGLLPALRAARIEPVLQVKSL